MNYRETIIEDDKTLDDSGSVTIPINVIDPITEILLKYKVKNDTAVARDVPPEKTISKIEIVDGGKVYMAMTGREAVAAACYDKGFWPPHWYCEVLSANQRISIPLQFGRYVGDPDFAFDPTKLKNPALKVTWAKDDLHKTGEVSLGVMAKIMEGVPGPSKCLLYRAVEEFTSAAEGVHVVDLLTDHPYRRLLIRAWDGTTPPDQILTHHKLDCDVGRLIVFDHDAAEFEDILRAFSGPFQVRKYDRANAAATGHDTHIAGRTIANAALEAINKTMNAWASGGVRYTTTIFSITGAGAVVGNFQTLITGEFPHSVYCYQFGRPNEPDTWFRAPQFKDVDLKLTQGVASAAVSVLLQQPVPLP